MFTAIAAASWNLDGVFRPDVTETPLLRRPEFDAAPSVVWAKQENLQVTGSFKFRGASAKLADLANHETASEVITASTGNHGAAVAQAAASRGIGVRVFVSDETDTAKMARIEQCGAAITVIHGDPVNAETAARAAAAQSGTPYISPYNDPVVVAGQGTIACELLRQLPELAGVVVAVGGGGLISGVAAVLKNHNPAIRIVAASAANSAAMHHSIAAGQLTDVVHRPTLSDGTAGGLEPDTITFEMCRRLVDDWLLVAEPEIEEALRTYMTVNDDRIEGSAAVALAAVSRCDIAGDVAVVLCGGNIAPETLGSLGLRPGS